MSSNQLTARTSHISLETLFDAPMPWNNDLSDANKRSFPNLSAVLLTAIVRTMIKRRFVDIGEKTFKT